MSEPMTAVEAANILERHNRWRRGGDGEMDPPALLGKAIDVAVAALRKVEAEGRDGYKAPQAIIPAGEEHF